MLRTIRHCRSFDTRAASRLFPKVCFSGEREAMEYDVVTVGGGPAGLSAAIRLKQLNPDISVCVVEKGGDIGAHVLSGNVFETRGLDELIPNWRELDAPISTKVTEDSFLVLSETNSVHIPQMLLPPQLHNDNNYIISLSQLVRWMGEQAEELGVEIYPGFAASEVLYDENGGVVGVATRDVGVGKDGQEKSSYEQGIELRAKQTLFSEGCRGSLSETLMDKFDLRAEADVQTYGLGVKEVWEVPEDHHKSGFVQHTLGWPLQSGPFDKTFGGTFMYHMDPNLVLIGMVVGLDYQNPHLSPYQEFQRWKHHPEVAKYLEGGRCISYGARALNEGGYHAIPKLTFPGGAILGCSAGFLNSVKIKGSHTAIKSGIVAAEAVHELLEKENENSEENMVPQMSTFQEKMENSWVYDELKEVRNCHGCFEHGLLPGLIYAGASAFVLKGKEPWTFHNKKHDHEKTLPASQCEKIIYPKPDGKLSFDLLSNLTRSGTGHVDDQPVHLTIKPGHETTSSTLSYPIYSGPEQLFCPAGVYGYTDPDDEGKRELTISAPNCLHCKTCDIKTPANYIKWVVPEGGGGPQYTDM